MAGLGWHSLGTTFECDCGETHRLPIYACEVGEDAAQRLAKFAQERYGTTCLVVWDENTRAASGDEVHLALSKSGKKIVDMGFGSEALDATDTLGDKVYEAGRDVDFFVAIGSGTISDLAKYAGDKLERPVLLYPTAASMNGYTSGIVAMKVRGLKRTINCAPAEGVFANPRVVATAPQRMTAAGVADFLSKCSSSTDWRVSNVLRDAYFCERPREFFVGTQDALLENAAGMGRSDAHAIGVLMEALLLSGCSMVIAGSSAPASGGEHLISHFLDMKAALYGTPHDFHGTQVGVGTVHCLRLWEKILGLHPEDIDVEHLLDIQRSEAEIHACIEEDWGDIASEIHEQWAAKALDRDALRVELERFKGSVDRLNEICTDLLPADAVAKAIRESGGPAEPEGLEAPLDEYKKALTNARFIRSRFTVLDLAAELGIT